MMDFTDPGGEILFKETTIQFYGSLKTLWEGETFLLFGGWLYVEGTDVIRKGDTIIFNDRQYEAVHDVEYTDTVKAEGYTHMARYPTFILQEETEWKPTKVIN